jgi:hypothetical protein
MVADSSASAVAWEIFPGGGDDPAARRFDAPDDLALHVEVTEQPVKPFGDEDGRLAELDGFDGGAELRPVGEGGAAGYRADVAVAVDVLVPDVVGAEREAFVRGLLDHGADLDFGAVPGVVVALGDADDADGSVGGGGVGEHRLERALRARSAASCAPWWPTWRAAGGPGCPGARGGWRPRRA